MHQPEAPWQQTSSIRSAACQITYEGTYEAFAARHKDLSDILPVRRLSEKAAGFGYPSIDAQQHLYCLQGNQSSQRSPSTDFESDHM
jgi:hypothetical protein